MLFQLLIIYRSGRDELCFVALCQSRLVLFRSVGFCQLSRDELRCVMFSLVMAVESGSVTLSLVVLRQFSRV